MIWKPITDSTGPLRSLHFTLAVNTLHVHVNSCARCLHSCWDTSSSARLGCVPFFKSKLDHSNHTSV